jgi:hypothetical protein
VQEGSQYSTFSWEYWSAAGSSCRIELRVGGGVHHLHLCCALFRKLQPLLGVVNDNDRESSVRVMTGSAAVSYVDTLPYNSRTMGGLHRRGTVDNTPKLPLSLETECRPLLCARITEIPQLLLIKHSGEVSFSITFLKVAPDLSVDTDNFAAPELMTTWPLQHCTMY